MLGLGEGGLSNISQRGYVLNAGGVMWSYIFRTIAIKVLFVCVVCMGCTGGVPVSRAGVGPSSVMIHMFRTMFTRNKYRAVSPVGTSKRESMYA